MKVLVVGSGGREHALVWKLAQSKRIEKIYCAPGNAGTAELATNLNISVTDLVGLVTLAEHEKIDLTIVGPEAPLVAGIADLFSQKGLAIFAPSKAAAQLEGSKVFAKDFLNKYQIPTAFSQEFSDHQNASDYLDDQSFPIVIKADGLAAGKGVYVCGDRQEADIAIKEIFLDKRFGEAGSKVIIEEFLEGEEASLLIFSDAKTYVPLVSSQDHKAAYDGDTGPNTGGMGAYSPTPFVTDELLEIIDRKIFQPVFKGLKNEGIEYRGILYVGLMIQDNEPYVLEFNVRFGDPETQVILPRLENDLVDIIEAITLDRLSDLTLTWSPEPAVCVVMASGGYPGAYEKGLTISGLDRITDTKVTVFHAGTKTEDGQVLTNGGRVLGVCAKGTNLKESIERAYQAVEKIEFPGRHYRSDIGQKALRRLI